MRRVLLLLALACAPQTEVVELGQTPLHPAVAPESVLVFRTPPEKFTEIALVSAKGWKSISANELLLALKKQAGARGANAIILETIDEHRTKGAMLVGGFIVVNKDRVARATAVRVP